MVKTSPSSVVRFMVGELKSHLPRSPKTKKRNRSNIVTNSIKTLNIKKKKKNCIKNLPAPTLSLLQFVTLRGSDATVARLKNCPALVELHDLLGEKLENNNFTVEHRAYRPHITLCRKAKFTLPFAEVTKNVDVYNAPFVANKVVLYQSVLSKDGPTYTPLYTITLGQE